jgi:transcription termination factor NusB
VKELKESNQTLQKELQDEKSNHQMTQLRAEKQEEWNRRELAQLKDELADKKKLMDNMISKELYKRDMDNLKIQNQTALVCGIALVVRAPI